MEQTRRPVIVCETGCPMDLFRTIDPGYADSNTPVTHLPIRYLLFRLFLFWSKRYPGIFTGLKASALDRNGGGQWRLSQDYDKFANRWSSHIELL